MKRTTIFLDGDTLQKAAQRTGVSAASLVREAVALYLDKAPTPTPLPAIAGRFASGHTDTSERADNLLWTDPHG